MLYVNYILTCSQVSWSTRIAIPLNFDVRLFAPILHPASSSIVSYIDGYKLAICCHERPLSRIGYTLLKNNVFLESHCALYSVTFDYTYATNKGQYDAQGNHYTISVSIRTVLQNSYTINELRQDSWTYSNKANPGVCNPAPTPTPSPANLNGGLACSQIQSSGYPCVCNQDSSGNLVAYASDNDCEGSPCKVNTDCSYGSICLPATRCLGTSRCAKSGATICTNFRSTRKMFKFKAWALEKLCAVSCFVMSFCPVSFIADE